MNEQFLNLDAIRNCVVQYDPFPHIVIENLLLPTATKIAVDNFPSFDFGGSVPVGSVTTNSSFKKLTAEMEGDDLRTILSEKFSLPLDNKPTLITLCGGR